MPIWMCPFTMQPPFITILNGTFIYRFLSYQYVCVWSVWWRVKVTNEFDSITTPLQSLHIIYTSMSVQRTTVFSYFSFSIWMYGICRIAIVLIRHIQQPNQPAMSNSISIFFCCVCPCCVRGGATIDTADMVRCGQIVLTAEPSGQDWFRQTSWKYAASSSFSFHSYALHHPNTHRTHSTHMYRRNGCF